jgi:hypothetical protein
MSDLSEHEFDPRLLDLELGALSAAEQEALRGEIDSDPNLRVKYQTLSSVMQVLASSGAQAPAPGLIKRTMARVHALGRLPRVVRPDEPDEGASVDRPRPVIRLGQSLRDIVAVAAMIVLAVGIGVPSMLHLRERAERVNCSRNLQALGFGVQQYARTYNASLPFAGWSGNASWQLGSTTPGATSPQMAEAAYVPNRRHVYQLLRMAYVSDPRLFICPAQHHVPMPAAAVAENDDFLEDRNVSYAYQNMAGVRPCADDNPALPILSDENPYFASGVPLFGGSDPGSKNSPAHGGAGQNILTLRGEVKWVTTPLSGINGDSIWTLQNVTTYTGREGPTSTTDAHLLK